MTVDELVIAAWQKAQGETPTFDFGSDEYTTILGYANFYQRKWARTPGTDWVSLYNPTFSIGSVTAVNKFNFDGDEVRKFSQDLGDKVRINWTDGIHYTEYDLVGGGELQQYPSRNIVARIGSALYFPQAFAATDAVYGGSMTAPVYAFPEALEKATDDIQVDDPDWLVCKCAYEIALHDILRKDTADRHNDDARDIMMRMKKDNEGAVAVMQTPWTPGDSY